MKEPVAYNTFFVTEEDLKSVPPYMKDTALTPQEVKCPTSGTWPKWLAGEFVRVGNYKYTIPLAEDGSKPNAVLQHFFDGLGSLHRFRFANGEVHYNSNSNTEGVLRNAKRDGIVPEVCTRPVLITTGGIGHLAPDEMNLQVMPRRGMHLAKDDNPHSRGTASSNPEEEEIIVHTDYNFLQDCDAKSLEPKRLITYATIDPSLAGFGICAHPPKDRKRGLTFNYVISEKRELSVFALNYKGKPASLVWKTILPCPPCHIHSLAISDKYVIFIRNPLNMDVSDMSKPVMEMIEFEPGAKTLFFVLDKKDGKIVGTFAAPNFMFFHSVNGYDYIDPQTRLENIHEGTLVRYELAGVNDAKKSDKDEGRATVAQGFRDFPMELPRINKTYSTVPFYRYVYATGGNGGPSPGTLVPVGRLGKNLKCVQGAFFNRIAKADWQTGKTWTWQPENGDSCPCEPVFIQRPEAAEEDDGVVLTIIINRGGTHSILVALDGKDLTQIARADMPQVYGLGPHGSFIEGKGMYP
ncbi:carotenoid oxygenase [Exophiala viscosa]|uniref:carotenoid oxygenase n=1 Tax=Exophiala viscosa TaxID=2486360 RepID=UPI0021A02CF7|nr:carotenoid oxygenase [Exophiala viscosa]